jgi:hypothetical protein
VLPETSGPTREEISTRDPPPQTSDEACPNPSSN